MFKGRDLFRLVLLVLGALLALGVVPEGWQQLAVVVPACSPLLNLAGALAVRQLSWICLLALPLVVLPLIAGRFFCWNICPVGFLAQTLSRLTRNRGLRIQKLPFIGKALALIICGSALLGYPLFIWSDPLSIFNGFFAVWHKPFTWLSLALGSGLLLIMLLSLVAPHIWCHKLCPLGGLEQWLTELGGLRRKSRKDAPANHPLQQLRGSRRLFLGVMLGGVSGWGYRALARRAERIALALLPQREHCCRRHRRQSAGGQSASGAATSTLVEHGCPNTQARALPLRPPGAHSSGFNALCARCGNCVAVCPYQLLQPAMGEAGLDGVLTPVMKLRSLNPAQEVFCFQDCTLCTEVCPTGALRSLTIAEKQQVAIGLAHICRSACLAWGEQEYCVVCQEYCPYQAIIEVEKQGVMCPIVDPLKCRGCGACESQCPAEPIAIVIHARLPQEELTHPSPQLSA